MNVGEFKAAQMHLQPPPDGALLALSLLQPWASLLAMGRKRYETRSWRTNYRGPLAIHASARPMTRDLAAWAVALGMPCPLPLGCVLATANLAGCLRDGAATLACYLREHPEEAEYGNFGPGRWAWEMADVMPLAPVPAKGRLGLWIWHSDAADPAGATKRNQ